MPDFPVVDVCPCGQPVARGTLIIEILVCGHEKRRDATFHVLGCVPPGGVLCASLELLPSANLEWIMEEDKRCLPVAYNAVGDVLHVRGFGDCVPAFFVLEHDA